MRNRILSIEKSGFYKMEKKASSKIKKVTIVGAVINIFLAGIKIAGGYIFRSSSLIADGVHSFSDLVTDAAVLFGVKFWSQEPDEEYPYGHGRIETFVTMFIGFFLGGVAVVMCYNAILGIINYEPVPMSWVTFGVAVFSIFVKEILFRYGIAASKKTESRALVANAWHHRSDAISSLPVALAVVFSKIFQNLKYLDQIATILVSVFLAKAAYDIISGCIDEFMEKRDDVDISPLLEVQKAENPEIKEFHKVNIRRVGASRYIDLHMLVEKNMSVEKSHALSGKVKEALIKSSYNIQGVIVHIEPFEEK